MQINKLLMRNFKQYKNTEISFSEGLTGFIGSNGSGKSTILEAVSYALYGRTNNAKDDIRNDYASSKDTVEIEVSFSDKGKDYTVRRLLKGKNLSAQAELSCDGILIASQATEVNKYIIKLLKIDYRNFKRSYFSEQKDVTALLGMKTSERQVEIRKMLGLEKLDKLEERVRDHSKELKNRISYKKEKLLTADRLAELQIEKSGLEVKRENSEQIRSLLQNELEEAKKNYSTAKQQISEYEELRNKFNELQKQLSVTRSRISGIESQTESLCGELTHLGNQKQKLSELLPLKQKYEIAKEELLRLLSEEAKAAKAVSLKSAAEEYERFIIERTNQAELRNTEITELLPLEQELKEKRALVSSGEALITAKNQTRDSIKEIISSAQSHLKQKQKRLAEIKKLGKDSPCPECERPLKEHYDKLVQEYEGQIGGLEEQFSSKTKDLLLLEKEIKNLSSEQQSQLNLIKETEFRFAKIPVLKKDIEQINAEISRTQGKLSGTRKQAEGLGEISFSPERLDTVRAEEQKLKKYEAEFTEISSEVKRIPSVEANLNKLREEKNILCEKESQLCTALDLTGYDENEFISLKQTCTAKEELKDELQHKFFSAESGLKDILNQLRSAINEIEQDQWSRDEIQREEEKINLYERLAVFVNNFKQRIASQEMPAISLEASQLFSSITRGRYNDLIIDCDYEIYVCREGNKVLLNTLSGGEKDLAGLCLRIAISKRIAALAGRENMGFLALDEVFGSQDETRREDLMNALYHISMDFRQIFVISHNDDVKEAFPNRLHVRKEGKYSIIDSNHL